VARRATLRASDADREAVAERLRQATVEGRIVAEELEERLEAVFVARTYGELDALTADLPARRVERRRQPDRNPTFARWIVPAVVLALLLPIAVAIVIAAAVFLLTGMVAGWAVWLVVGWWVFGHRSRGYPPRRRTHPTRF
jgi:Domain of unknown function (DUF1707)